MEKHPPNSLYKFYSFSEYSLEAMCNNSLWFGKPESFNDPYDCSITMLIDKKEYIDAITESINSKSPRETLGRVWIGDRDVLASRGKELIETLKNIGICCFTNDPRNMTMWAHYGDQHKGFCVEYDCSEKTELRRLIGRVKYSKTRACIPRGICPTSESISDCWLIKANCWRQEKEWRAVLDEGGRLYENLSEVKSIIFGARASHRNINILTRCMRHNEKIKYKKISLAADDFNLKINAL